MKQQECAVLVLERLHLAASNPVSSCFYPRPHKPEHGTCRGRLNPAHARTPRKVTRTLKEGGGAGISKGCHSVGLGLASNTMPQCLASTSVKIPPIKQCTPTRKLLLCVNTVQQHCAVLQGKKKKKKILQGLLASSGKHLWLLFLVLFMARGYILHSLCILFLHQLTMHATRNSQRLLPKQSPVLHILHIPSPLNVLLLMF